MSSPVLRVEYSRVKANTLTEVEVNISIRIMVHIAKVARLNYNAPAEKAG